MSCRFLTVQLQTGQILTACEEGHKFSKYSSKSDQPSRPVHFLFSSTNNHTCYLVRRCNHSDFLWSIPIALHQIHHCSFGMLQGDFAPVPLLCMDLLSMNLYDTF